MLTRRLKIASALLAGLTLVGAATDVMARPRYNGGGGYRHRGGGIGGGAIAAGAALGILGAATAGVAANRYYNGYPAYSYGPGYGARYGYDYHPSYGYYGPY